MQKKILAIFCFILSGVNMTFSQIQFVNKIQAGQGGINGFGNSYSQVFSKDNKFLYVLSSNSIVLFEIDTLSDKAIYKKTYTNNDFDTIVFFLAEKVIISNDNKYLYITQSNQPATDYGGIMIFYRDTINGELIFQEKVYIRNMKDINPSAWYRPVDIIISEKNDYLILNVYDARGDFINIYQRNILSGKLALFQSINLEDISKVRISNDGQILYIDAYSSLTIYRFNKTLNKFDYYNKITSADPKLSGLTYLNFEDIEISKNDKYLYISSGYDAIIKLNRNLTTNEIVVDKLYRKGYNGVDYIESPYDLIISPDSKFLYCHNTYSDSTLSIFSIDQFNGDLTFIKKATNFKKIWNSNGIDIILQLSPNGKFLTEMDPMKEYFLVYTRDSISGDITKTDSIKNNSGGLQGFSGRYSFNFIKNGKKVIVAAYTEKAITILDRDPLSGLFYVDTIYHPSNDFPVTDLGSIRITNDHRFLYMASFKAINVFRIDTVKGRINFVQKIGQEAVSFGRVRLMRITNNQKNLYVAADDAHVIGFKIDSITGMLSFIQILGTILSPPDYKLPYGFNYPDALTISNNDKFLYISSERDGGTGLLQRNDTTGLLVHKGAISVKATSMSVHKNYNLFYASTPSSVSLIIYQMDSITGALKSIRGSDKFELGESNTISPDHKNLLLSCDDHFVHYKLSADGTNFTRVYELHDGNKYTGFFDGVGWSVVSPDSRYIYLIHGYDCISTFRFVDANFIELGDTLSTCEGKDIELDALPGYTSYKWSTGATTQIIKVKTSGNFSVTVTDENGRVGSDTVFVKTMGLPKFTPLKDTSICEGEEINLKYSGGRYYFWNNYYRDSSILVKPTTNTIYSVKITSDNGCLAYDTIKVNVFKKQDIIKFADTTICPDNSILVQLNPAYHSINWFDGSGDFNKSFSSPGKYWLNIIDTNNCGVSDTFALHNSLDSIKIYKNICEGQSIWLQGEYQTKPGVYYDTLHNKNGCDSIIITNLSVSICTGLQEDFINNEVRIYPNPANNLLNIDCEKCRYELYSLEGKLLITSDKNAIDISFLNRGIYILKVFDKFNNFKLHKVAIERK